MVSARRSLLVSFGERYTLVFLGLIGTMVIARLLPPAEIGIYSIGAVLVGLTQVLRDFGVGQYIVAAKTLSLAQMRAALGVSVSAAWMLALLIALLSAPMAQFYGQAKLQDVMRLLALNFVLVPFSAMTLSCLRRQLRFSAIYLINTTHGVTQLCCTLWLAGHGYGCLSLAWGTVAAAVAALLVGWPLRPAEQPWVPSLRGARSVLSFGYYATAGNIVDEAGVAAPDLAVGKLLGADSVAIFGKAQALVSLFSQTVTSAVSPILLPMFAGQAREGRDPRAGYLLTVSYMTAVSWPFFALLGALAPSAVKVLYGDQWDAAIPLTRIMCCSAAMYSMFSMARYLFVATGHVRDQARLDTLAVALRIVLLVPAAMQSLHWVALAVVASIFGRCWLTWRYLQALTGIGGGALLCATGRSAAVTALTALAPAAALLTLPSGLPQLAAGGAAAVPLWVAGVLLFRHPLARELELAWRKLRYRAAV